MKIISIREGSEPYLNMVVRKVGSDDIGDGDGDNDGRGGGDDSNDDDDDDDDDEKFSTQSY